MQFKINFNLENEKLETGVDEKKEEGAQEKKDEKLFGLDENILDELYSNSSKTDGENDTPYGHY